MIPGLAQTGGDPHRAPDILARRSADLLEERRAHVVGAGEGREEPAGLQAAQRAEVDLLVAAERRVARRPPA